MSREPAPARDRLVIVAIYVLVFWGALPAGLWRIAGSWDRAMGWSRVPWAPGWLLGLAGLALLSWGIAELYRGGGGLPVSALPPPRFTGRGPYRWVRHPIYLGFNLALVGVGLGVGSRGLGIAVSAAFLPAWVAYALVEELGLVRRFGQDYRRYQRRVGLFPRPSPYRLVQLLLRTGVYPLRIEGRDKVPASGGVVLIANHSCYLDPAFAGMATGRTVHFLATAEAYRGGIKRWFVTSFPTVPLRRYRIDAAAVREMRRLLAEGEVVCLFVEGERCLLGNYQGATSAVVRVLARLPVPVVPVGISGAYDAGPRWADALRRRPVTVRVGEPLPREGRSRALVDRSIRALLDVDPQPVHLEGLQTDRLVRVLWRCPRCLDEPGWDAGSLRCGACEARWTPTAEGWFADTDGRVVSLAELARPVWEAAEVGALEVAAEALIEREIYGPIRPLEPVGRGTLRIDEGGLHFEALRLSLEAIHSTSTERSDTLQIASSHTMWQFRLEGASAFRWQRALDRWRGVTGYGGDPFLVDRPDAAVD